MSKSTLLLFLISVISVCPSNAISPKTISGLCSRTTNSTFCLRFLQSTPGVASADLRGVYRIVLNTAGSKALQTKGLLVTLAARSRDHALKQRYSLCLGFYDRTVANINNAKRALTANDLRNANQLTLSAIDAVEGCEDEYEVPLADPSDVRQRSNDLEDIISVAFATSTMV